MDASGRTLPPTKTKSLQADSESGSLCDSIDKLPDEILLRIFKLMVQNAPEDDEGDEDDDEDEDEEEEEDGDGDGDAGDDEDEGGDEDKDEDDEDEDDDDNEDDDYAHPDTILLKWTQYLCSRNPAHITGVCIRWRTMALEASSLWARWDIKLLDKPSLEAVECLDRFITMLLNRSGQALLEFSLDLFSLGHILGDGASGVDSEKNRVVLDTIGCIVSKLFERRDRWKSADIRFPGASSFRAPEALLGTSDMVNLEGLSICNANFAVSSPNATPPSLAALRALTIIQTKVDLKSLVDVGLVATRQLEELIVRFVTGVYPNESNSSSHSPIVLPTLRHLDVQTLDYGSLDYLVGRLTCPGLERLVMGGVVVRNLRCLEEFLGRSESNLCFLNLPFGLLRESDATGAAQDEMNTALIAVLQKTPLLTSLTVSADDTPFDATISSLALKNGDEFELVPNLKSLKLSRIYASRSVVSSLLTKRWKEGQRSLKLVQFSDCMVTRGVYPLVVLENSPETWEDVQECMSEGLEIKWK